MREIIKTIIWRTPIIGGVLRRTYRMLLPARHSATFPGTAAYWDSRYAAGGDSGVGSYRFFAEFKAEVLNEFVRKHNIQSVIEFGCGDGNQLRLAQYPLYTGFDISSTAIKKCGELFHADRSKSFGLMEQYAGQQAELALSLDVVYHLVEDEIFLDYMRTLFGSSTRFVIVYSSDTDDNRGFEGTHVRHRKFTEWIERNLPAWRLIEHIPNRHPYRGDYRKGSFADFFIFERVTAS